MEFPIRSCDSFCGDFRIERSLVWVAFIQSCNNGSDRRSRLVFVSIDETDMKGKWALGIRDHRRKQEGMGMSAYFAVHPHNRKGKNPVRKLDVPFVRAVTDETAGMPTGTGNEV